jgi:hypothetical protein
VEGICKQHRKAAAQHTKGQHTVEGRDEHIGKQGIIDAEERSSMQAGS